MLTIKKELDFYDFIEEFEGYADFADEHEALSIIYDSLCGSGEDMEEVQVRDYIRFQVQEMDTDYFIDQYGHLLNLDDDADEDTKHEAIEECLNYHTYYIGFYEYDNKKHYLFDEF
jgi:hypothetical protein